MENRSSHRRRHRQLSHDHSHAKAVITPTLQGHNLVPTDDAIWIDSEKKFLTVCEEIEQEGIFSFDTEFIGEESYYPKTCLVQVATTKVVALIDPFKIRDLSPLYALIASPDVITVLHSGIQDLEPVARVFKQPPSAIFDTQLVSGIVGFPWPISLTRIIESVLDHSVGGHFTFSQWDARPLSGKQCIYAADDVRYLLAIHEYLSTRLKELDRTSWAEEECATLTSMHAYAFKLEQVVKRICRNKHPKKIDLQRIQALVTIRETIAKEHDQPTRVIIPDECVLSLARKPVETIEQLASIRGFPRNIARQHGQEILDAVVRANDLKPFVLRRPHAIEKEVQTQQELEGAWSLFGAWCVGNHLSTRLVTNRVTFTDWYLALREGKPATGSPLNNGWRNEAVGQFANMIQHAGEITFSLDNGLHAKGSLT